jgi:hypothetical protein
MSHALPFPPPGFEELSIEEQVEYAGALWDYITSAPDEVPVPDWHKEILAERIAKYSDGAGGWKTDGWKTWEQVQQELNKEITND